MHELLLGREHLFLDWYVCRRQRRSVSLVNRTQRPCLIPGSLDLLPDDVFGADEAASPSLADRSHSILMPLLLIDAGLLVLSVHLLELHEPAIGLLHHLSSVWDLARRRLHHLSG